MLGISINKAFLSCFSFITISCISIQAVAKTNDLLRFEQWALESQPPMVQLLSTARAPLEPKGTCASTPNISGDSYSCSEFTAPAVGDIDLNVYQGWDLVKESQDEVIIALIDTGIDYQHPDLKSKVWLNSGEALYIDGNNNGIDDGCEDGIDLDHNGYLDDCHGINTQVDQFINSYTLNPAAGDPMDSASGHGTNMAGVLGAIGNNGSINFHGGVVGITGIHNNIKILTCAAADIHFDVYVTIPNLGGAYGSRENVLECFNYFLALKQRGENIVVVNGSGGASEFNNLYNLFIPKGLIREKYLLNTPEVSQAISQLAEHDINLVVAAGNNGWDIDKSDENAYYPAAFGHDNIIAVGAINNQGERWKNSSYGRWSVDVFAPGERILSTNPRVEITQNTDFSDYVVSDGSSQATAYISGMLALARSYSDTKDLTASELRRLMVSSGKALPALSDTSVSGKLARMVDDNNNGLLNCDNQQFQRRQSPRGNTLQRLPGEWLTLEIASYNCHAANDNEYVPIIIEQTGETLWLMDNGIYPDSIANDGIFTAQWQVRADFDIYSLNLGNDSVTNLDDIITVNTSIIVDNLDRNTHRIGGWWSSIYRSGFYRSNYRYAYGTKDREFKWTPEVTRAGYYEVFAHWPNHHRYTRHAEYTIHYGKNDTPEEHLVVADQSQNGGEWNSLGVYWFDEGAFDIVLSNKNITAAVIADAIKLKSVID